MRLVDKYSGKAVVDIDNDVKDVCAVNLATATIKEYRFTRPEENTSEI